MQTVLTIQTVTVGKATEPWVRWGRKRSGAAPRDGDGRREGGLRQTGLHSDQCEIEGEKGDEEECGGCDGGNSGRNGLSHKMRTQTPTGGAHGRRVQASAEEEQCRGRDGLRSKGARKRGRRRERAVREEG